MDSSREIENLLYTYAERIDSGDFEAVAELFSHADFIGPDGKHVTTGAAGFLKLFTAATRIYAETGTPRTKHVTTNAIIEVDESANTATSRSYFTVLQQTEEIALQPIIAGRYSDSFERVDGRWRFSKRQTIPELFGDLSKHMLYEL